MFDTSKADVAMANLLTVIAKAKKHNDFYARFIRRTNWPRLHRQKVTLINVANDIPEDDYRHERLHGVVNFLDDLQDAAVDIFGLSEAEVFDNPGAAVEDEGDEPKTRQGNI